MAVLMTSCGLKFNDTVEKPKPTNVEETCFSQIDKVTESYYLGQLSKAEIESFKKCTLNTIDIFRTHVAGEDKKENIEKRSHKKEELKRFFQKVIFTEDKVVTDSLMNSLMLLKVSIVGGSENSITNKELKELKPWIEIIADSFNRINPYMKIISKKARSLKPLSKDVKSEIISLERELNIIGYNFYTKLPDGGRSIKISELNTIATELMKFYGWDKVEEKKNRLSNSKTIFDVFKAVKEALLNENDGDLISKRQWQPFTEALVTSYKSYLSAKLAIDEFKSGRLNYQLIDQAIESAIHVVNSSLKSYKKTNTLPVGKVNAIIEKLYGFDTISNKYKLESLKSLFRVLQNKLFNPFYSTEDHPKDSYAGISKNHIGYMTNFKNSWLQSVKLISNNNFSKTALWSIRDYIKPFFAKYDFSAQLSYEMYNGEPSLNVKNLIMTNSMDHLVRLIIKAYAVNDAFALNDIGLTADEIQEFTDDIRPVLLDLKLINPDIVDAGDRMYFEGNLFTATGNGFPLKSLDETKSPLEGILQKIVEFKHEKSNPSVSKRVKKVFYNAADSELSYQKEKRAVLERDEMINMGLYIFSSAKASDKMYKKLIAKAEGCAVDESSIKDLYCKKMVPRQCFEDNLFPMMDEGLSGLKELHKFIFKDEAGNDYTSKEEELDAFKEVMMGSITLPNEDTSELGYMHVVKLAQISHYVETSFLRFDLDKNGRIDKGEVNKAYPHFEGLIDKMVKSADVKSLTTKRDKKLNKLDKKLINDDISREDYTERKQHIVEVYDRKIKKATKEDRKIKDNAELEGAKKLWSKVKRKAGEIKKSVESYISDKKRKNIFLHMMYYGNIPSAGDVAYAATLQNIKGLKWEIDINRLRAFGIFGGVINSVNADSENQEENFSYRAKHYDVVCD